MSIKKGTTPIGVLKSVSSANLTNLSITPTTSSQTFNHSGYDGYDVVTCGAVTSSIDSDIKASNIKSGVNILGVNGSVVELKGETKTVTPTTSQQTITPSSGKNGITSVTVNAVTSSIDPNITAANIVSGKTILGVNGSAVKLNGTTKTITPTTSQQTLAPSNPYNGYTSVTVNGVTSAIDSNIKAENIKKNVSILGVTGSYEGGSGVTIETGKFTPSSNINSKTVNVADNRKVKIIEVFCDPDDVLSVTHNVMTCVANLAFVSEPFYIGVSSNLKCYSNLEERITAGGTSVTATAYRAASSICPGIATNNTTTVSIGTAGSTMYYLAGIEYTYRIYSW